MMFIRREIQCKYHVSSFVPVFYDVFKTNSWHFLFSEKKTVLFLLLAFLRSFLPFVSYSRNASLKRDSHAVFSGADECA